MIRQGFPVSLEQILTALHLTNLLNPKIYLAAVRQLERENKIFGTSDLGQNFSRGSILGISFTVYVYFR